MTMEERVEAAARAVARAANMDPDADWTMVDGVQLSVAVAPGDEIVWRMFANHIRRAFPELTGPNPTHVIVPLEPSEKTVTAAITRPMNKTIETPDMYRDIYEAMIKCA